MSILFAALQQKQFSNTANVDVSRLREGTVLVVKSGFGFESPETVTLRGVEIDGKNGQDVIDYTDCNGKGRWAYTSQIVRVITY